MIIAIAIMQKHIYDLNVLQQSNRITELDIQMTHILSYHNFTVVNVITLSQL